MDVQFEFKEKNGGACVTKLLAPGAVCVVPESLGGLPVTELADKVFSGSTVEKVYLPRTLTRIGRYEFYGCEKLQEIHFYGTLREVGGGVFTGCRNIRSLTVIRRSRSFSMVREAMTPGTPQPVPTSTGMKLLPDRPNFRKIRSMMKATRDI